MANIRDKIITISGSNRLIKLTEVGDSFYHYARQMVGLEDEIFNMVNDFRELQKGRVSLGATYTPATYMLPRYISEFKDKYPLINISLEVNTAGVLLDMLKNYELDMAILSHYQLEDSDLSITTLMKDDLIFVCSPLHPLAGAEQLQEQDLQGIPLIMHEKNR
jgi:DNA-binding transcriptional LysR family regulator